MDNCIGIGKASDQYNPLTDLLLTTIMKITSLHLHNYRNFRNFKVNFDQNLTVLVANNSAGKTSILDAIAVALGPYIGAFPLSKNRGFKYSDATLIEKGNEPLYPVVLDYTIQIEPQSQPTQQSTTQLKRELRGKGSKTTTTDTRPLQAYGKEQYSRLSDNQPTDLPIIAYYGTGRLWRKIKITQSKKESGARSYGYRDCLEPASNFNAFKKWFIEQSQKEYGVIIDSVQSGQDFGEMLTGIHSSQLMNIRKSIDLALQHIGWNNFKYNGSDLVLENREGTVLPVEILSDGMKSMLALVADIAYRCSQLNSHYQNASVDTEGIVLIDEVDMHLHPSWQQRVLTDLTKIFPNIQFIVTSHSPQVLSSVKSDNIRIIDPINPTAQTPLINPYGQQSIVALEDIMNVNAMPALPETKLLKQYMEKIEQGETEGDSLVEMRQQLESIYGKEHETLQIADMIINKHKAKQQ